MYRYLSLFFGPATKIISTRRSSPSNTLLHSVYVPNHGEIPTYTYKRGYCNNNMYIKVSRMLNPPYWSIGSFDARIYMPSWYYICRAEHCTFCAVYYKSCMTLCVWENKRNEGATRHISRTYHCQTAINVVANCRRRVRGVPLPSCNKSVEVGWYHKASGVSLKNFFNVYMKISIGKFSVAN